MAGSVMTAVLNTQYDGSGFVSASKGLSNLNKDMADASEAANTTGINFEGMFKRLERPLGFLVFGQLSQQLTDIQAKGQTTTMVLEKIFSSVGMSLMFVSPPLGIFTLGMTALWDIFEKVRKSGELTSDELIKQGEDLQKGAEAAANAADILEKKTGANDLEVQSLRKLSEASQKQHDDMVAHAEVLARIADQEVIYAQHTDSMGKEVDGLHYKTDELTKALENQKKAQLELIALENQTGKKAKTDPKEDQMLTELRTKAWLATKNLSEATKELKTDESLQAANEAAILSADTDAERANFEKHEEDIKKRIALENEYIASLQDGKEKETSAQDDLKSATANQLGQLATVYSKSGKDIGEIEKEMLSSMITDFANTEAGKLSLAGMADIFINPALGAAELAGAAAITALGSSLAGALGGGGGGGATTPAGVTAAAPSTGSIQPPGGSGNGPGQGGNLYVTFAAPVVDPGTAGLILKSLNQIQQNNGWTLGSTFVNGAQTPPGLQ
jgi:hypothetical protein